jgi:spore cortex biosynthesis protein YabQ
MDHINVQLSSILIMILAAMIFGVIFDMYRVFRGKILGKKGRCRARKLGFHWTGDLVFWVLVFIVVTPIIFWGTWLELRFYVWLIFLAGIGLYLVLFSPVVILWILGLWNILTWVPRKLAMGIWRIKIFSKQMNEWFFKSRKE